MCEREKDKEREIKKRKNNRGKVQIYVSELQMVMHFHRRGFFYGYISPNTSLNRGIIFIHKNNKNINNQVIEALEGETTINW